MFHCINRRRGTVYLSVCLSVFVKTVGKVAGNSWCKNILVFYTAVIGPLFLLTSFLSFRSLFNDDGRTKIFKFLIHFNPFQIFLAH